MMYKTKVLYGIAGALISIMIIINLVAVDQVSATNYLVTLEVKNNSPLGATISGAGALVYDDSNRHIADAWLSDSVDVDPSASTEFIIEIDLQVPVEELEYLTGHLKVYTEVHYQIGFYRGIYSGWNSVPVDYLRDALEALEMI